MPEKKQRKKASRHPGFEKVALGISKREGVSPSEASAILAASSRKASRGAKRSNPRLKRVR